MDIGVRQGSLFRLNSHAECDALSPATDLLPRIYVENLRFAYLGRKFPDHGQDIPHRYAQGEDAGDVAEYRRKTGYRTVLYRNRRRQRLVYPDLPVVGGPRDFQCGQQFPPDSAYPSDRFSILPYFRGLP